MDKIVEEIKNHSRDGKITCKEALDIAGKYGEKPIVIGKKLNELKIKIKGCQLGCFK